MDSNIKKLYTIIQKSSLSNIDKEKFLHFFKLADKTQIIKVINILEDEPQILIDIKNIIKEKQKALRNNNQEEYDKIIQNEYNALLNINT